MEPEPRIEEDVQVEEPRTEGEPDRPWIDLATNRPGAASRERAVSLRGAAPVRTLLERAFGAKTDERARR